MEIFRKNDFKGFIYREAPPTAIVCVYIRYDAVVNWSKSNTVHTPRYRNKALRSNEKAVQTIA